MEKLAALFQPRFTLRVHNVQIILIVLVFILTIVRISMTEAPITRATIMTIPISIKSLIILAYQLLTEYRERFRKWASLKANMILNIIEIPFWAAAMGLTFSTGAAMCVGSSCAVSMVVGVHCLVLLFLAIQAAVVSTLDWRHFRRHHSHRGSQTPQAPLGGHVEDGHPMGYNTTL